MQTNDKPIEPSEFKAMADAISKIQNATNEIIESGINKQAIMILLSHKTGISQRDCRAVLDGLHSLGSAYLTPEHLKRIKNAK